MEVSMTIKELFEQVSFEELKDYFRFPESYEKVYNQVIESNSQDPSMLVCLHDEDSFVDVYGLKIKDLKPSMADSDILSLDSYALELTPFDRWAGWKIANKSLNEFGMVACVYHILSEMTFISFDTKDIVNKLAKLKQMTEDIKSGNFESILETERILDFDENKIDLEILEDLNGKLKKRKEILHGENLL